MNQQFSTTAVPLVSADVPVSAQGTKFTDTFDIDQESHRLYYGDNWAGGIDVFDISSPKAKYLQTIRLRGGIYGVGVAKNVGKLFVGLTGSLVAIIDIDPASRTVNTVIRQVDTGGRGAADLLDYDTVHKKLYAANRNDGFMAAIDGVKDSLVARTEGLGGGLEQPRFNPVDGMIYLAGNTDSVLYQIDPVTDKLVKTFKLDVDCRPNGMAINPNTNQALLMTANREHPQTVLWDFKQQRVLSVFDQVGSGDGAIYSSKVDKFLIAASGDSSGPVVGILSGNPVRLLRKVPTGRTGSWVGLDETNLVVYVPTIQDGRPALTGFALPKD